MSAERETEGGSTDEMNASAELGDGGKRVHQDDSGKHDVLGGGELPDPNAPPTSSAPGSVGLVDHVEPGHGQFQDAYDADPERAAVGSIKRNDA